MSEKTSNLFNYIPLFSLFTFWGFLASSNGIFIPYCKTTFQLSQFQSQLIDTTFYGGYFFGSLTLFVISYIRNKDFLAEIGFKKGLYRGIAISMLGCILMIPSLYINSYLWINLSFFVITLGFSLQQTCAQPLVVGLGSAHTANHRLNLAGGLNSFGTLLGPLVFSFFIFGSLEISPQHETNLNSLAILYFFLSLFFLLFLFLIHFLKINTEKKVLKTRQGFDALKYPQVRWAMLGIFIYVGVEVTIQSNLGALLKLESMGGYKDEDISIFIAFYWGSLMIGRWAGAVAVFVSNAFWKHIFQVLTAFIALALIYLVNYIYDNDLSAFYYYFIPVSIMLLGLYLSKDRLSLQLIIFSCLGLTAILIGLLSDGLLSLLAYISAGLFCSTLWPCIFSIGLFKLGDYKSQASTFMIMMIVGGAIIPPIQGWMADIMNIRISYIVPLLCFAYLIVFGLWSNKKFFKFV